MPDPKLDEYFDFVQFFEFNLGLGPYWWPALAQNDSDYPGTLFLGAKALVRLPEDLDDSY